MANLKPEAAFSALKERVKVAISKQFPYEGKKRRLELVGIEIKDDSDSPSDPFHIDNIQSQYDAKTKGKTWAVPVKARLRLVDVESGRELNSANITLARLPKITRRYTYIVDGNERQHDSTFRLRSRPYHLIANNGEIRAQWNLARGYGFNLKVDPKTALFRMEFGTSNIPIYSVLKTMGVTDSQMEQAWGGEVLSANKKKSKPTDLNKIHKVLVGRGQRSYRPPPLGEVEDFVRKTFDSTKLRPDAMESAFGKPYDRVNGENLLLSTTRLLDISKGTREEDDRQALSAKDIASTDDYVVEAIERQTSDLRRKVLNVIDLPDRDRVTDILSPNAYSKVIKGVFNKGQLPEQTNPLQFLSSYQRTTLKNPDFGGVKGEHAALEKDKEINPTHLGLLDPIRTPESDGTGITLNIPIGARKKGMDLVTKVWDVKAKQWTDATAGKLEHSVVAYPDQVKWVKGLPRPISPDVVVYDRDRNTSKRPWRDVDYVLRSAKGLFSWSPNMIPFLQNDNGNRAMMGAKQYEQAVSLKNREAPLVQTAVSRGASFERMVGMLNSHHSPVDGTVSKVTEHEILVSGRDGKVARVQVYNNFPLNGGKNFLTATPVVKVGQQVKKGQLLADTNYTRDGNMALGANLRVAYMPYRGLNFEDGIVVSESAARTMTSMHMYVESATVFPGMIVDKKRWRDYALPEKATPERMKKLGNNGVIKEGETVHSGDILIALLAPSQRSSDDAQLAAIHRSLVRDFRDKAVTWDHDHPGVVKKVIFSGKGISVHIGTEEPLQVGDKLSGRHGNKGIVSTVLPDHEMPKDAKGNPVQVLLSPDGVPSRINVGQVLETAASKIAKKTGQPYVVNNFEAGTDYAGKVLKELKKHGLSDTEELFDAKNGRSLGQVLTGNQYLLKLHHQVEKKMTARGYGGAYTGEGMAPSGSGVPGGGQKLDLLTTYAMLAHGAKHNLREAYTFKSDQDQDEVWLAVQEGRPLPSPKPTRTFSNFLNYMRAMGVNVDKKGNEFILGPMTDDHTEQVSNGEIKFPNKSLRAKGARTVEEAGGLFDPRKTGGMDGKFWTHMKLHQRVPNPLFETPIKMLLDIKGKDFEELVGPNGIKNGKSGFDIINSRLSSIDVDKMLGEEEAKLSKLSGPALNKAYRKVRYLRALKETGLSPLEAYTNRTLPIVPPSLRRVSIGLDGTQILDDLNSLYLSVGRANDQLKKADKSTPSSEMQKMKANLYESVRGLRVTGLDLGGTRAKRHHLGLMEKMKGVGSPKYSYFQKTVMGRRQDLSGRSTIIPAPELELDEMGIPTQIALEMYKPFVVQELHKSRGYTPLQAQFAVKQKDPAALEALQRVVERRPVMAKRDPALHKFSIMAFKPKLTHGKAIGIHPLVTGGFNADFDGDSMAIYVPVGNDAVEEAKGMMPSNNIFSPTSRGLAQMLSQDMILGVYKLTKWGTPGKKSLATAEEIIKELRVGNVDPSDVFMVGGKQTTAGRLLLASVLPPNRRQDPELLYDQNFRLTKGNVRKFLTKIAKEHPGEYAKVLNTWKNLGSEYAYRLGSSISLKDFHDGAQFRDSILKKYEVEEKKIRSMRLPQEKKDKMIVDLFTNARDELTERGRPRYTQSDNRMHEWVHSGAKGNWTQFAQMVFGPMIVVDPKNNPVPVPIKKSFGEGLSVAEYWTSMHGARKGVLDRASGTADPGAEAKVISSSMVNYHITGPDCGTKRGVAVDPNDSSHDVDGRYLAAPVQLRDGSSLPAGTLLDTMLIAKIRNSRVSKIVVRSPLYCEMPNGICQKCYGLNEAGKSHAVGVNIGIIAGQSMTEPMTQMRMRTFHTGGVAGGESTTDAFTRAKQLLSVPKKLKNEAVLATVSGQIMRVEKNLSLGGYDVYIGTTPHRIPGRLEPLTHIQKGISVRKGEPLSSGVVNPHDLLGLTNNIHVVRGYLTDELKQAYGGTARRNIETVVRGMTNVAQVVDAPDHPQFDRGQRTQMSEIEDLNRKAAQQGLRPIKFKAQLRPLQQVPLETQEDWMARANFRRLQQTFEEGAAQGWVSNPTKHPIPGLAFGALFGKEPKKKDEK